MPSRNRNKFKVTVIGAGEGKSLAELLYEMSGVLLGIMAKVPKQGELEKNNGSGQGQRQKLQSSKCGDS